MQEREKEWEGRRGQNVRGWETIGDEDRMRENKSEQDKSAPERHEKDQVKEGLWQERRAEAVVQKD